MSKSAEEGIRRPPLHEELSFSQDRKFDFIPL